MTSRRRLIVIGAGPMGLEAALGAKGRGLEVTVLEKGRVGESLRQWGGATRFFSPFSMNVSDRARAVLGARAPDAEALLTGPEMADGVLEPLARALGPGCVREGHTVNAVGRARLSRRDLPGHPLRAERPFRLLVTSATGEAMMEADFVLDASGVYGRPAALGAGGIPAPGEGLLNGQAIRRLGELEARLDEIADRDVLLVGHGHSAANALEMFARMPRPPRVLWATRSPNQRPCVEVANDPLPERERITRAANDLAAAPPPFLRVERRASVDRVMERDGRVAAWLTTGRQGVFDVVVGLTGYRPDLRMVSELALEVAPSSEGAARLTRALSGAADCLAVPRVSAEDLASGEPGFHLVGSKSYGRLPTFLLKNGLTQLELVLDGLCAAS